MYVTLIAVKANAEIPRVNPCIRERIFNFFFFLNYATLLVLIYFLRNSVVRSSNICTGQRRNDRTKLKSDSWNVIIGSDFRVPLMTMRSGKKTTSSSSLFAATVLHSSCGCSNKSSTLACVFQERKIHVSSMWELLIFFTTCFYLIRATVSLGN